MDTHAQHPGRKLVVHTVLSILVTVIGVVLLIYMITAEDEPGALPLLLIVSGVAWLIIARVRLRR
jgi:hypothetical protein